VQTRSIKTVTVASVVAFLFLIGITNIASALTLEPPDNPEFIWQSDSGETFAPPDPNLVLDGYPLLELLYKSDFGGTDSGIYASSYQTTWGNFDADNEPFRALIEYIGGLFISYDTIVFVAKDGQNWNFIWDISYWNGTDSIELLINNPPYTAAISHVAIWGAGPREVPEPSTLLLLGAGLIGLAFCARKRIKS
jgi:hypothetical protein